MRRISIVFRREFSGYFATPLAAIFWWCSCFWPACSPSTLAFFDCGQADLRPFFQFHLVVSLGPGHLHETVGRRATDGHHRVNRHLALDAGSVLGKFFAAWAFSGLALLLTVPMWWTVSFLGEPDRGVIVCSYLARLTARFLGDWQRHQQPDQESSGGVRPSCGGLLLLLLSGFSVVLDFFRSWAPNMVVEGLSAIGVLTHFDSMVRGVIDLRVVLRKRDCGVLGDQHGCDRLVKGGLN